MSDQPAPRRLRILLVEDEEINRRILAKILSRYETEVKQAVDGQEALEVIDDFGPDVVITDLNMPRVDGLTLLRQLRGLGHQVPVMVLSAHNETHFLEEAEKSGTYRFLFKPIKVEQVAEAITALAAELGVALPRV